MTDPQTTPEPSDDPLLSSVDPGALPDFTESMRLLTEAQAGDDQALDDLLRRYEDRLRRIVRIRLNAKLRRCVESVDIVQETFRSALGRINELELRSTASILQWLSKIAENHLIDTHRRYYGLKRDRTREIRIADARPESGERLHGVTPSAPGKSPLEEASQAEIARIVDEAVAELPDDYREVIMLRTYYGGSWDEVTRQMGRPTSEATRQLHRRARIRLARMVKDKLEGAV